MVRKSNMNLDATSTIMQNIKKTIQKNEDNIYLT